MIINVTPGVSDFYLLESDDGTESFQLDVHCGRRNRTKASFQLRYEREIILARLCTSVPHTNPDGITLSAPHFHRHREGFGANMPANLSRFPICRALLNSSASRSIFQNLRFKEVFREY